MASWQLRSSSPDQHAPADVAARRQDPFALAQDRAQRLRAKADRLFDAGRYSECEVVVRALITLVDQVMGTEHPDFATVLGLLADVRVARGDREQAESILRSAVELRRRIQGEHHLDLADELLNLAQLVLSRGRRVEALALIRHGLEIRTAALGPNHPDTLHLHVRLARLLTGPVHPGTVPNAVPSVPTWIGHTRPTRAAMATLDDGPDARQEAALISDALTLLEGALAAMSHAHRSKKRRRAMHLLDRVGRLTRRDGQPFPPLERCQATAAQLRTILRGASVWPNWSRRMPLIEGNAAYAALLTLVGDAGRSEGSTVAEAVEAVRKAFGAELARAAAGGELMEAPPALSDSVSIKPCWTALIERHASRLAFGREVVEGHIA